MKRAFVAAALAAAASLCGGLSAAHASTQGKPQDSGDAIATFHGRPIDLSKGWGQAKACNITEDGTVCYSSEIEMDAAIAASDLLPTVSVSAALSPLTVSGGVTINALGNCSSYLRLYDGTNYTGALLGIGVRGTYVNLSSFGFDNVTSSYKVGACYTDMFSGASGGGSVYPGYTGPGAAAPTMASGWSNAVSSVYLY